MAEKRISKPASSRDWGFYWRNISTENEKSHIIGESGDNRTSESFLNQLGFEKDTNGDMVMKAVSNTVEKENGKIVARRTTDGKVLTDSRQEER